MKILIVDDHKMVLEGLQKYVTHCFPQAVIQTVSIRKSLFEQLLSHDFHVLLLDLSLNHEDSLTFIKEIIDTTPAIKIICVSSMEDPSIVHGLLKNAIHGFVGKSSSTDLISIAINTVLEGKQYIDPNIEKRGNLGTEKDQGFILTRREKEVLRETLKENKRDCKNALYI